MRLQSAIFDMDGTLLDSMPTWRELGPTFLKEAGISATPEQDRMLHTLADCDVIPYLREVCGLPWSQQEIIDQIIQRMETFYSSQVRPKPGLEKFLSILKMEGVWMYVATATHRRLTEKALKTAGIDHYFRGIVTSADAGNHKSESASPTSGTPWYSRTPSTPSAPPRQQASGWPGSMRPRRSRINRRFSVCATITSVPTRNWSSLKPSEHRKRSRMAPFFQNLFPTL